jgi:hypothetical protein
VAPQDAIIVRGERGTQDVRTVVARQLQVDNDDNKRQGCGWISVWARYIKPRRDVVRLIECGSVIHRQSSEHSSEVVINNNFQSLAITSLFVGLVVSVLRLHVSWSVMRLGQGDDAER